MQKIPLSNKQYFSILWSWIEAFEWEKSYYSTSSIKWTEIWEPEEIILYDKKPSRANMQPIEGAVWFAKMSQTIKVLKINKDLAEKSILSTGFSLILPNKELVSSDYLKFFFISTDFNSQKDSLSTGSTQVAINNEWIKKISIPLPPLPLQHLIVQEIEKQFSRLDEWLASLKRAKENLKRYKASVLKSAIEGKLTEGFRDSHKLEPASKLLKKILEERKNKFLSENPWKKYKEPEAIKPEDVPNIELPEGWEWANIESICENIVDCPHSTPNFQNSWFNCIDTNSIKPWNIIYEKIRFVNTETYKYRIQRMKPQEWDVLFSREWALLWIACIVPKWLDFCLWQRIMIFRLPKLFNSKLFEFFLNSEISKNQYKKKITGTAAPHLNISDIRQLILPLPPLPEQNEIVKIVEEKLSVVEKLEKLVNENIKKAENLKQSILKKAFEGELVKGE